MEEKIFLYKCGCALRLMEKFKIDISPVMITEDDLNAAKGLIAGADEFRANQRDEVLPPILEYFFNGFKESGLGVKNFKLPSSLSLARQNMLFCLHSSQMWNFFTVIKELGKLSALLMFFKECRCIDKNISHSMLRLRTMPIYAPPGHPCFQFEMTRQPDNDLLMVLRQQIVQFGQLIDGIKPGLTIPPQYICVNGNDRLTISLPAGQTVSSEALDDIEFYAYHLGDVLKVVLGRKFKVEVQVSGTILRSGRKKSRETRELLKFYGLPDNGRNFVKISLADGQDICVGKIKKVYFVREECAVFHVLPLQYKNFKIGSLEINIRSVKVKIENGQQKWLAECENKGKKIKQILEVKVCFI